MSTGHLSFIYNQMFLITVGIIMTFVSIVVGIDLYLNKKVDDNRTAVSLHLHRIAEYAQAYYKKDPSLGGGGNSFLGFRIQEKLKNDENGKYRVVYLKDKKILLEGVGIERINSVLEYLEENPFITHQLLIRPAETRIHQVY